MRETFKFSGSCVILFARDYQIEMLMSNDWKEYGPLSIPDHQILAEDQP